MMSARIRNKVIVIIIILFVVNIIIGVSFFSCSNNINKSGLVEDERLVREVDSVFNILKYYFSYNPDSAIIIATKAEDEFIKTDNYRSLVRLYSYLSEIYQYRKRDDFNALVYILKAMDVMANNPDLEFDKTYLYINVGNIMYHYELYEEAIYIYREIREVSNREITPEINSLIYNNIGLSYQAVESFDSARYYFSLAENVIDSAGKGRLLLKIQSIYYKASIDMQMGNLDSIPEYYSQIESLFAILDKVYSACDNPVAKKYREDTWVDYYTNRIRAKVFLVDYYSLQKDNKMSMELLNDALEYNRIIDDNYWFSEIYMRLSGIYKSEEKYDMAEVCLDSVISSLKNSKVDYKLLNEVYLNKADISEILGDIDNAEKYKLISEKYSDSLTYQKNSYDFTHGKIELSFRPIQLAITNIKLSRNDKIRTIQNQKTLIYILIGILFIIIISVIIYYRLNSKLNRTRKELALRTIEKLKDEKRPDVEQKGIKDDVAKQILKKIEEEIVIKKAYIGSNINLNDVADMLQTNRSYISKLINSVYEKNFNDYINELRIKEACNIICNNTKPSFTIDHLYSEVGFASKSTFYSAFKKYTGVTPAIFFKMNNNIDN